MDPVITSALIGAGTSLLGQGASSASQGFANNLNWRRSIQMWRWQNQYNTPAAQMQRLKDAGLNPNLMYGNGSASTGLASAPSVPKAESTFNNPAFMMQAAQSIMDMRQREAMRQKTLSEKELIDKQTARYDELTQGKLDLMSGQTQQALSNAGLNNIRVEYEPKKFLLENDRTQSIINLNRKQSELLDANRRIREYELSHKLPTELKIEINRAKADIALKLQQQKEIKWRVETRGPEEIKRIQQEYERLENENYWGRNDIHYYNETGLDPRSMSFEDRALDDPRNNFGTEFGDRSFLRHSYVGARYLTTKLLHLIR